MVVVVTNAQRQVPVRTRQMNHIARCAIRRLRIRTPGTLAITFVNSRRMRAVNRRFLRHDRTTDVISFRYDDEPIAGDILIDPLMAWRYAKDHGVPYPEELARYVVHGILHWVGHNNGTAAQQRKMRSLEDQFLTRCRLRGMGQETRGKGNLRPTPRAPRPVPPM